MEQRKIHLSDHKVALLATGDEICQGDILNTNAEQIARELTNFGIHVGMHLVTGDNQEEIQFAIQFLLQHHAALIITGGLGPTSDDLTRYALSQAIAKKLTFDEAVWNQIVARLNRFGYKTPPLSNQQQALFPEGATIIPNPNGTAAGCEVTFQNHIIFMLPGPPNECLPMLKQHVLPALINTHFPEKDHHENWLLFGVSEGEIAEKLDALANPFPCTTGYRLCYPYLEFKLRSKDEKAFNELMCLIKKAIAPYIILEGKHTASHHLREKLAHLKKPFIICDLATHGSLEAAITTPGNHGHLHFTSDKNAPSDLLIEGLNNFWKDPTITHSDLTLTFKSLGKATQVNVQIPVRGERVKQYVVEWICWKMLENINQ